MDADSPIENYDDQAGGSDVDSLDGEDDHLFKREGSHSPPAGATGTAGSHLSGKNAASIKSPSHLQKRRRVTRACDECRRKKIKCDGKQPCTHCTVYSYDCTYDQPSNRRRNPAPQYVENLEHRVHRAETLLHILIPNLDLNDPGIDAAVAQGWIPGAPGKGTPGSKLDASRRQAPQQQVAATTVTAPSTASAPVFTTTANDPTKTDTNIESMLRAVAQLDMDAETGDWGYHGHSSGLSFVRRMREQLGDLMGPDTATSPFVKSRPLSEVVDSPRSVAESPINQGGAGDVSPNGAELPPKTMAREICTHGVEDAAALLRVVHPPSFWASFERLYNIPADQYTNEDQKFLPLFYSAMALGTLFGNDGRAADGAANYESAIHEGIAYFRIARQLMDIADCRSLVALQAVLFMMLFLQSSAKLSQCYAYVGVALRSALRMGLHRSHGNQFNPLESEIRKRIFWVVRKMDIYIGAMLGLPLTLSDDDIDQDFPAEVDDEYLTREAILPMPEGQVSLMTAFNAHTRLVQILSKIMRYIYPIKANFAADKSYSVPFSAIREIESDLEEWKQRLPPILNPCPAPERYTRVQQLLRISYAHAQIMLYRPFLHFVAMDKRSRPMDQRSYACAASYVNVSRNIVHIQTQMKQKGLLNGGFWFTQYTTFFAILSLVYFAAENPDNAATEAVMKDALEGKQTMASLSSRSMAADRCNATLDTVFSRLPEWMRNGQANPIMSRKRHLDTPLSQHAGQASRSYTDVSVATAQDEHVPTRARTFPMPTANSAGQHLGASSLTGDVWSQPSGASTLGPQTPTTGDFVQSAYVSSFATNNAMGVAHPLQQYTLPPENFANPALADISVMFPAADEPFSYPHQPLTTYEHQLFTGKSQAASSSLYTSYQAAMDGRGGGVDNTAAADSMGITTTMPPSSRNGLGGEDGMEAQFFALPPYMDRQQYPLTGPAYPMASFGGGAGTHLPNSRAGSSTTPSSTPGSGAGSWGMNTVGGSGVSGMMHTTHAPAGMPAHHTAAHNNNPLRHGSVGGASGLGGTHHQQQINIQEIFGGNEWNPMLVTGYQTQQ